jgi:putative Holliday junction resolvase
MRFLCVDYGTKRIGLAVSDESGILAFPMKIVSNNLDVFETVGEIIKKENIGEIIIGESVDFSGKLNVLSERIEIFISELKYRFDIPIHKQKEFMTSVEARRSQNGNKSFGQKQAHSRLKQKKSGHVDASAAALILQRYLDKINLNK